MEPISGKDRLYVYLEAYGILGILQISGLISWIQSWVSAVK